ncbi:MAG: hypothetical protein HYX65_00980 [Gemmatimonadetes bacterium]|nr:hypothetical protein [Gemmatimonadota bacterium]
MPIEVEFPDEMGCDSIRHHLAESHRRIGLGRPTAPDDTSNPLGNEAPLADLLAPKFRALAFGVEFGPTPVPGIPHFIDRLRGDGSRRPRSHDARGAP